MKATVLTRITRVFCCLPFAIQSITILKFGTKKIDLFRSPCLPSHRPLLPAPFYSVMDIAMVMDFIKSSLLYFS